MKELTLLYVHGEKIGYARYGTYLAEHLATQGVDVYDRIEEFGDADAAVPTPRFLIEQQGTHRHKKTNVVAWVSVPTHARGWWDGQVPVISTMWEADTLPEGFRENLHNFDTVIVPSTQNLELFSEYHPRVRKVPLGVDLGLWRFQRREQPTTEFRFLIGGSGPRKGVDLAVKAFRRVFPDGSWGAEDPTPVLVLKNPKGEDYYAPRLRMVSGYMSAEDEVALYAHCHCYLQPSRGEGFGLQPLQAIAQGMPTILTDAHGHHDFAHLGIGLDAHKAKAQYFIYGDAGCWWEPDFEQLCEAMRYVYDNWGHAERAAQVTSEVAHSQWGWQRTAARFVEAIGADRLEQPYAGSDEWFTPPAKLFRVRLNRPWKADIAGSTFMFQPGVDYWEQADVKRILFEADLLDPACVDGGDGLTAEQVDKIQGFSARHSYCPTCSQKLGSGITRGDEIFAELQAAAS